MLPPKCEFAPQGVLFCIFPPPCLGKGKGPADRPIGSWLQCRFRKTQGICIIYTKRSFFSKLFFCHGWASSFSCAQDEGEFLENAYQSMFNICNFRENCGTCSFFLVFLHQYSGENKNNCPPRLYFSCARQNFLTNKKGYGPKRTVPRYFLNDVCQEAIRCSPDARWQGRQGS